MSRTMESFVIDKPNYFNLDHPHVIKSFEGDLRFINYFSVEKDNEFILLAIYEAQNPNLEKNHKKYVGIGQSREPVLLRTSYYVVGFDNLDKDKKVMGIGCLDCCKVVISLSRHDYRTCGCKNEAMADGGRDYLRCGALDLAKTVAVEVNLLTDEIKVLDEYNQV